MNKICRRYHHFTHVYPKSQSYDVRFLKYGVRQTEFLWFWTIFCPFTNLSPHHPLMIPKIKILKKKMKKMPRDIILLHIHEHHKWALYDIWPLNYTVQQKEIFVILGHFLSFQPPKTRKIKILKLKKAPGDIIIIHICTINDNLIIYGSWEMECDRQNFLSFWTIFCPLTSSLWTQKTKILKKWKKHMKILSFYKCVP